MEQAEPELEKDISESYIFFTTSTTKLIVMSLFTLGLYGIYWFYKNWVVIKKITGKNIWPFWRAVFSIFFMYSCFKNMLVYAQERNIEAKAPIGLLASINIILFFVPSIPSIITNIWFVFSIIKVNNKKFGH